MTPSQANWKVFMTSYIYTGQYIREHTRARRKEPSITRISVLYDTITSDWEGSSMTSYIYTGQHLRKYTRARLMRALYDTLHVLEPCMTPYTGDLEGFSMTCYIYTGQYNREHTRARLIRALHDALHV